MKKILILSAAPLIKTSANYAAYSPYVKELELWAKYSEISFCCPVWSHEKDLLHIEIKFPIAHVTPLKEFSIRSFGETIKAIGSIIINLKIIFKAFKNADHIHLRCPGNIALLGCLVQLLFPYKKKTAKYAGNWDPNSAQPLSYKLQKWILNNTFLTRNMQVLVYGEWENMSGNIKPFFTATYRELDKVPLFNRDLVPPFKFLFVGTLSVGKQPIYALKLVEDLILNGFDCSLQLFGEGPERKSVTAYIYQNSLTGNVQLMGNKPESEVRDAYRNCDFLVLPSLSEGWPKVVAEAMFWGCVPISSPVSCVPFMVAHGKRGILLENDLEANSTKIQAVLNDPKQYSFLRENAILWSREFTLDRFENEIKALI